MSMMTATMYARNQAPYGEGEIVHTIESDDLTVLLAQVDVYTRRRYDEGQDGPAVVYRDGDGEIPEADIAAHAAALNWDDLGTLADATDEELERWFG